MSDKRAISSASNLYRRVLCPGSESAELFAPPGETNAAAELGTLLHAYDANPDIEIEDVAHVDFVESNRALRENFLAAQLPNYGIPVDAKRVAIQLVRYTLFDDGGKPIIGPDGMPFTGEPDIALWFTEFRTLIIFDSKFGRLPVPTAAKNYQLRCYAVMMADPDFGDFEAERVVACITQPLVSPPVHAVEFDVEALRAAKSEIIETLQMARVPNAERIASAQACFGCRASATCKAANKMLDVLAVQRVRDLPVQEVERLLVEKVPTLNKIIEQIETRVKYIGKEYPHLLELLDMVPQPNRMVIETHNASAAFVAINRKDGETDEIISADEFIQCCEVSRVKLAKLVAKKMETKLDHAEMIVARRLGKYLTAKPQSPRLKKKKSK